MKSKHQIAGLLPVMASSVCFLANLAGGTPVVMTAISGPNGATGVVATFNEAISLGTGTITIKDLDTPAQTVITLPDARV